MSEQVNPDVAIVDYGMGNLFSVKHACEHVGLRATITRQKKDILSAGAVILPGVGAFGVAMESLAKLDLIEPIKDVEASGTPLIGICLGMQLFMRESHEFGRYKGLGLLDGEVVGLRDMVGASNDLKVPQIGWNSIYLTTLQLAGLAHEEVPPMWQASLLSRIRAGEHMYFVHSYYCRPEDSSVELSRTRYGGIEFCSSVQRKNLAGFQFHPERSGEAGLQIYRNLAVSVRGSLEKERSVETARG